MSERRVRKLDELASIVTGTTPKSSDLDSWGDYLDFVTPSDQNGAREASVGRRLSIVGKDRLRNKIVPPRSTALTCIGATIGKISMNMVETVTNQQINSLVARPGEVDPDYLYYLIRNWSSSLGGFATGSATPIVNKGVLSGFVFEVDDLDEQIEIGKLLRALDDKIAANRIVASSSAELQLSVWTANSRDAPMISLVKVATPRLGGTPPRTETEAWVGPVKWASVRDLTAASGGILLSTAESISVEASRSARRLNELPEGTVVLTARGTVGEVVVLGVSAVINQSAYAFVPEEGLGVVLRLGIESLVDSLRKRAHGSVFSTITTNTLEEAEIPDFFTGTSGRSTELLEALERMRVNAMKENQRLAATRDELLPLLMSGKITVKDAEKTVEEVV